VSPIWKLNSQLPETHNLGNLRLNVTTQAPDVLTLTQAAAYDADPVYPYGSPVTLTRNNGSTDATWFKGICTGIARRGSGTSERIEYQISGPWWQLQQVIYRQQFSRYVGGVAATPTLAKLILGTDEAGARLNSGQVIAAVVNYALAQLGTAALFQLGTVQPATQMPYEELNALSCADVISRVLRWNPDIVAWFDYATDPTPTLHFTRRTSLTARTYAIGDVTISENSINPRNDLQKDGVVIQYERNDTIDGAEQKTIITDTAGSTSDPTKTLYLFFDLQGSSISYVNQAVKTATIQASSATWWATRHPKLKGATAITVANHAQQAVDNEDEGGEDDGSEYGRELISGSIAEWMSAKVNAQIITADVTYTPPGGSPRTETLRLQLQGTNATTQTYSSIGSSSPAEPTPTGLAASILASLSTLPYEGSLTLHQAEAGADTHINTRLNITGGRSEWASMAAQVYQTSYDLDTGRTQINFGPAKHLGATDLFQLLRNVRTRQQSSATFRTNTTGSAQNLPTRSPNTTTADDGGSGAVAAPLQAYKTGTDTIKVKPGTVDGIVVTAAGGAALDAADVTVTDGYQLWLVVTLAAEGGAVATAIMQNSDPGADTATQGSRLAVQIAITGGVMAITNYLSGSQDHDSCGTDHSFILS